LQITSKLSNHDHSAENVRKGCQTVLDHLKTDYLDLFLMHWPVAMNEGPSVDPPIQVLHFNQFPETCRRTQDERAFLEQPVMPAICICEMK
jgi:diketogulonate reductase-like aldo/keto reductase